MQVQVQAEQIRILGTMSDNFSQIMGDKLDKGNFQAWKFRMMNFLMGKRVWGMIMGADKEPVVPDINATAAQVQASKAWNEKSRKVLHWLSICMSNAMIGHIQECTNPKDVSDVLVNLYDTSTHARKLQLKQDLHDVKKGNLNINDYALKVKSIVEKLGSIGVTVDHDDLVAVILNGLGKDYKPFQTSIAVRKTFPCFNDLIALLISEEIRLGVGSSSSHSSDEHAFYSKRGRGRGHCGYGRGRGSSNDNAHGNNDARFTRG